MKSLASIFPNASQDTIAKNPRLLSRPAKKTMPRGAQTQGGGKMTGVESEFALYLEAQKRAGEILRYEFQGISLRWGVDEKTGDSMHYTPDFLVIESKSITGYARIKLIEVKGPHIHYRQQAIARFKGCRSYWPEFEFQMWQKQKSGWKQIL